LFIVIFISRWYQRFRRRIKYWLL